LKFNDQLGTWLKKSNTKDQKKKSTQIEGLIWNLTCFGANFGLNEMARFGKNDDVSCISLEKKERKKKEERSKRCRFEQYHKSSSSLGRAEDRWRRRFCPPAFAPLPLSPKTQKKKPDRAPHLYVSTAHTSHDEE